MLQAAAAKVAAGKDCSGTSRCLQRSSVPAAPSAASQHRVGTAGKDLQPKKRSLVVDWSEDEDEQPLPPARLDEPASPPRRQHGAKGPNKEPLPWLAPASQILRPAQRSQQSGGKSQQVLQRPADVMDSDEDHQEEDSQEEEEGLGASQKSSQPLHQVQQPAGAAATTAKWPPACITAPALPGTSGPVSGLSKVRSQPMISSLLV